MNHSAMEGLILTCGNPRSLVRNFIHSFSTYRIATLFQVILFFSFKILFHNHTHTQFDYIFPVLVRFSKETELIEYGPDSSMAVSRLKGWESGSCQSLWSQSGAVSQRIPGKLLVFSLCQNPEEFGFSTGCSNRIDELANEEGKQTKSQVSFFQSFTWAATRFNTDLVSNNLIKKIPHRSPQQLGFQLIEIQTC